jgi:hypothetical protein
MGKSRKMERYYHAQGWATRFQWKEGAKLSDVHCRLFAVCGVKAAAGITVFNWVWSFKQKKGICTGNIPKNGSLKPSVNSQ